MSKSARVVPHVYSEYDPPPDFGVDCSVLPSMTQQNFKDECDINNIVNAFVNTGMVDHGTGKTPRYDDVSDVVDFHTSQNLLSQANEVFDALPLKLRRRFKTPVEFLDFIADRDNLDEARTLGLLKPAEDSKGLSTGATERPHEAGDDAPVGKAASVRKAAGAASTGGEGGV
ncbi:MAG: internal scaffolding protein [Arizlama microvirus]|nr:MAG: internal scaffolding protein [Arizlama microvirus]